MIPTKITEFFKSSPVIEENRKVIIAPKPKILLSMRSAGYDNYSAIADIVDNCFDEEVNASHIKIYLEKNINSIVIADDGCGMTEDRLIDALSLGSDGEGEIKKEDLGKYGCGLKTAFSSMARRMVVITKTKKSCYTAIYDIDEIQKTNFEIPMYKSTKDDFDLFKKYSNSNTGTVIIIEKIDNLQIHRLEKFSAGLIKHLSEIYRHIIGKKQVTVFINKTPYKLTPFDPMFSKESVLWNKGNENITIEYVDREGNKKDIKITVKLHILPYQHRSNNLKDQGFYIIRNGRQIERAVSLGMYTKHSIKNRFRAELQFNSINDDDFNVNFQKNSVRLPFDLSDAIAKKIDLESLMSFVISESGKGKNDEAGETKTKKVTSEKAVKATEMTPPRKKYKVREKKSKEKKYSFDWVREDGRSEKDSIYRIGYMENGRCIIHINTNHIFCRTFETMSENQQISVCSILLSIDTAHRKLKTEVDENLFYDFDEIVSSETTKLLSLCQ